MPIATSLVLALLASPPVAAGAAALVTQTPPPMIVNLSTAPTMSSTLIARMLDETDAIWRDSGFTFVWRRTAREVVPYARTAGAGPSLPSRLRVVVGNDRGESRDHRTPLGWIAFDDEHSPAPEIYISYANVRQLLEAAPGVVGNVSQMTGVQREVFTARAMGRALAHEIGHYLLASKIHTPHGLMQGSRTANEFFSPDHKRFQIDPAQQQSIAARLLSASPVVRR